MNRPAAVALDRQRFEILLRGHTLSVGTSETEVGIPSSQSALRTALLRVLAMQTEQI